MIGVRDRQTGEVRGEVIPNTTAEMMQGFVIDNVAEGSTVYTDEHRSYRGLPFKHETVRHSVSEYVRDQAHTNGLESFWATLKRGYHGVYHHMSHWHLFRYVNEFAERHNMRSRGLDTVEMMGEIFKGMVGNRLRYRDLIAANPKKKGGD